MATKLTPLRVSLTIDSVGANSPKEESKRGVSINDYLAQQIPSSTKMNNSRRNDALSRSLAVSSTRSSHKSTALEVLGN